MGNFGPLEFIGQTQLTTKRDIPQKSTLPLDPWKNKQHHLVCANNEHTEKEIRKTVSFKTQEY